MFKRKLTEVAVDSFTEYLTEKFEKLKELDLDNDGRKDVDQILEILHKCGNSLKDVLESTDFSKMATGLDQIASGTTMIGTSFDRKKVETVGHDLKEGLTKLGELAQLGIAELKDSRTDGSRS